MGSAVGGGQARALEGIGQRAGFPPEQVHCRCKRQSGWSAPRSLPVSLPDHGHTTHKRGSEGGLGWLAFQPEISEELRADRYEMRLRVEMSSGEVVNFGRVDDLRQG